MRSDHLSFPSALLAGRAMFRFFPPQAAGSVTELFQTLRQSDVGHSPQRHFTSYSLSHPKKARPFRLPSALPSPFPFPDDFVIGQVIPTGTTPTPYHVAYSTSFTMNSRRNVFYQTSNMLGYAERRPSAGDKASLSTSVVLSAMVAAAFASASALLASAEYVWPVTGQNLLDAASLRVDLSVCARPILPRV